jgi:hypothetical protein
MARTFKEIGVAKPLYTAGLIHGEFRLKPVVRIMTDAQNKVSTVTYHVWADKEGDAYRVKLYPKNYLPEFESVQPTLEACQEWAEAHLTLLKVHPKLSAPSLEDYPKLKDE